jgi:hypothetical protein
MPPFCQWSLRLVAKKAGIENDSYWGRVCISLRRSTLGAVQRYKVRVLIVV